MNEPDSSSDPAEPVDLSRWNGRRLPVTFGMLVFGFGVAAGFLLAFSGYGLEDSAGLIVSIFLALIAVLLIVALILLFYRRRLWSGLFGRAEAQLELFAEPLSRVASGAAARDPKAATDAARDLLQLTFARYAWISTRRWLIAALTGLIAAMAALSGTALLFKQNQLIEVQSGLLTEQNVRIAEQTALLETQVELAEADRNAALAVEMTEIAALLGAALDRTEQADAGEGVARYVAVLDPDRDISQSLRMRIISASRASKPYRFLAPALRAYDTADKMRVASERRRDDLPLFYEGAAIGFRWQAATSGTDLIDRPASPERAQLLEIMTRSGLRALEGFNFFGLDLSFAYAEDMSLFGLSLQGAQLSYATFARAQILETDFGGASLENTRFDGARIQRSQFRSFTSETALGPYAGPDAYGPTFLAGASFVGAFLRDVDFAGASAITADFDGATLHGVSLAGTVLGGATFREAVLLDVDFAGAGLQSVEFDGAFVLREDFLDALNLAAAQGTFRADRYELEPSSIDALMQVDSAFQALAHTDIPEIEGDARVWRVKRVKPFEE
ncbi:pentapeptide repeat-containing protein [Roseovarius pelagicus]|uniref:Pentapeptide repeat-containing protein n=1 Tax=Roseovarius pelagicus TaxID=2980108 RepID=A0ABY6DF65_9RHOB|nr:pentapeptide repeat-containing protein [Roseovarius pelagicus]UXX84792.1 pentapeptide repeat-containing protein [Roseovarius pelagicus]